MIARGRLPVDPMLLSLVSLFYLSIDYCLARNLHLRRCVVFAYQDPESWIKGYSKLVRIFYWFALVGPDGAGQLAGRLNSSTHVVYRGILCGPNNGSGQLQLRM